jgi:hypothetical protein
MLYYKIHENSEEIILAVADKDVLGKKYASNGRILDLITFSSFYQGQRANENDVSKLFSQCTSINLVGKLACSIAISKGFAKKDDIVDIGGLSHIQLYKLSEDTKSKF